MLFYHISYFLAFILNILSDFDDKVKTNPKDIF